MRMEAKRVGAERARRAGRRQGTGYLRRNNRPRGPTMPPARRAFLDGLIDYAGLFPPAELALEPALDLYGRYRTAPDAWMLGRFLIPARASPMPSRSSRASTASPRPRSLSSVRRALRLPRPRPPACRPTRRSRGSRTPRRSSPLRAPSSAASTGARSATRFEFRLPVALALDPDALAGVLGALAPRLGGDGRAAVEIPFLRRRHARACRARRRRGKRDALGRAAFAVKLRCGGEGVPCPTRSRPRSRPPAAPASQPRRRPACTTRSAMRRSPGPTPTASSTSSAAPSSPTSTACRRRPRRDPRQP